MRILNGLIHELGGQQNLWKIISIDWKFHLFFHKYVKIYKDIKLNILIFVSLVIIKIIINFGTTSGWGVLNQ